MAQRVLELGLANTWRPLHRGPLSARPPPIARERWGHRGLALSPTGKLGDGHTRQLFFFSLSFKFETGSCCVAQAGNQPSCLSLGAVITDVSRHHCSHLTF